MISNWEFIVPGYRRVRVGIVDLVNYHQEFEALRCYSTKKGVKGMHGQWAQIGEWGKHSTLEGAKAILIILYTMENIFQTDIFLI